VGGENYTMRSFIICVLHQYHKGDNLKEDEMDMICTMHRGDKKFNQNFSQKI
jgi:hypothetical protein